MTAVTARPASRGLPLKLRPLWALSWVIWRLIPGRAATKMAEFAHTEAGSGLDMLAAVEQTPTPELRLRYYRHALDELKHSRMFRERAKALSLARNGGKDRTQAVLEDDGYIQEHGINTKQSLFQTLGELEFLAFVWVHEKRGAEQFEVYSDLLRNDAPTAVMFEEIARDERFHIAYSRQELVKLEKKGAGARMAVLRVRSRRLWQGWLRFSHRLGQVVTGLWLALMYIFVLGPFSIIARLSEKRQEGLVPPQDLRPAAERAREMG